MGVGVSVGAYQVQPGAPFSGSVYVHAYVCMGTCGAHGLPKLQCNSLAAVGLEEDVCQFHQQRRENDPTCRLCGLEPEDPAYFINHCPTLTPSRDSLLHVQTPCPSPTDRFLSVVLGIEWIDDPASTLATLSS